jgi:hypothetical protein
MNRAMHFTDMLSDWYRDLLQVSAAAADRTKGELA